MRACNVILMIAGFASLAVRAGAQNDTFTQAGSVVCNLDKKPYTGRLSTLSPNFDIYLPNWLAQYNKGIFGVLFVAGELVVRRILAQGEVCPIS